MSDLVHCIYTSVQTHPLQPAQIDALIEQSRESNRLHGITGILLHVGSTFFQVLEGPRDAVDLLYSKILTDPRHTRVTRIIYERIARRYFGDVRMSLATLSQAELAAVLDEVDPGSMEMLLDGIDEGRAKRLLRAFTQGRWRARLGAQRAERQTVA